MELSDKLKHSVLFQGGYDCQNTGDDAFAAILAWGANHYWGTKQIKFLKKTVPVLPVPAKTVLTPNPLVPVQTKLEMATQMTFAKVMIFGGGSVFFQGGGGVWQLSGLLSKLGKLSLGATGVSLGPYKTQRDRQMVEEALKKFSFLVLRDHRSYLDACQMDLPYEPVDGFDLAMLLPQVYSPLPKATDRSVPIIGISICHYERYVDGDITAEKKRENKLLETLKLLASKQEVEFRLLVFNGDSEKGDGEISEKFVGELKDLASNVELIPYSNDPFEMWKNVADCNLVIATRLHSGIFSYAANIPFLQVEYHQKCTDFLDEVGYPENSRLGDMNADSELAVEKILTTLQNGQIDYSVPREEMVRRSEYNFTALQ